MGKNLKRFRKKKIVLGRGDVDNKFILPKDISTSNLQNIIIAVHKKRWRLVDTFKNSSQNDRHYIIQRDENGMVFIQFGDGINGAKLPEGKDNVTATYRTGAGEDGNITNRLSKRKISIKTVKIEKE